MDDLKLALAKNTNLSGPEMLAIASQFVGNLIAAQDQRRFTSQQVMRLVSDNIEEGNRMAIAALLDTKGSA
jgi:hypothetical protein